MTGSGNGADNHAVDVERVYGGVGGEGDMVPTCPRLVVVAECPIVLFLEFDALEFTILNAEEIIYAASPQDCVVAG
jgi:hypothetical protein